MSPASLDASELERYVGACLFSQKSFGYHRTVPPPPLRHHNPNGGGGAGGGGYHWRCQDDRLAQLAVHARGAPLILTKNAGAYKRRPAHQKNALQHHQTPRNVTGNKVVFVENPTGGGRRPQDALSVTSDESSSCSSSSSSGCSQQSEPCLPRIIKPRKRRKKERKAHQSVAHQPHFPPAIVQDDVRVGGVGGGVDDDDFFRSPALEADEPKLHHSFDEVEEVPTANQPASTCQCRYCDPEGQIWDADRPSTRFSPSLSSPEENKREIFFDFGTASGGLGRGMAALSLSDEPRPSRGDLEVSTEIVTSPNGHRDLEIRFWLSDSGGGGGGGGGRGGGASTKK